MGGLPPGSLEVNGGDSASTKAFPQKEEQDSEFI
jgi:hypothetical protein